MTTFYTAIIRLNKSPKYMSENLINKRQFNFGSKISDSNNYKD